MIDPVIHMMIAAAIAILFLDAGIVKLRDLSFFRSTLKDYRLVPDWALVPVSVLMPIAELSIAVACIIPASRQSGLAAAAALLILYAIAMGINLARGRSFIDCGCHGPAEKGQPEHRISRALVIRNLVLAGVSLAGTIPSFTRSLQWIDYLTCGAALMVCFFIYAAVNRMISEAPRLKELQF